MVPYRIVLALAACCVWAAAAAAVWPRTSFSGAGGEAPLAAIEGFGAEVRPALLPSCRVDLAAFGRERMRALIASGYPSSLRYAVRAGAAGERYLAHCPAGPFLAVSSLTAESAAAIRRANGSRPLYATP